VAYYLSQKPYVANLNVHRIARLLEGRSCAELENVINQAAVYAAFDGRSAVEMKDAVKAILRIIFAAPEKSNADVAHLPLIACHEAGHAAQHAENYAPIKIRNSILPVCNIGSTLSVPLLLAGVILSFEPLVWIGIGFFSFTAVFQLVTLPVEFNASNRAVKVIESNALLSFEEKIGAEKVLEVAAMTYVAALAVSLAQLLRLIVRFTGRRR
jgi:Zn-dependent membrane protease YugP